MVKDVFKRPKLKTEIFKEKKFEEDNYRKIRDALRDCAMSYCIAAAYEFKKSQNFPDVVALKACYREDGNHNKVIIESFLKWIEIKCDEDPVFKYHSRLFLHYGPLMELFDFSTHFNFGLGRETVFIVQLPTFAQLGFRNYYSEVFIHVINLIAKWPIAFRKLLEQNCSVNLSGKCGKGIELDCWVESRIVKPTKKFLSGHTTVKACTRLGGSVDMVNMIKEAYRGRSAFDDHTTTRHSVPSALPDQLKGAWFCITKRIFAKERKGKKETEVLGISKETVPKMCINVEHKGRHKIKENFRKKLFDSFPDVRYVILDKDN